MLHEELKRRCLPGLLTMADGTAVTRDSWPARRAEVMELLRRELYGILPALPYAQRCEVQQEPNPFFMAGKAILRVLNITVEAETGSFTWQAAFSLPRSESPVPVFVMAGFEKHDPVDTIPTEEILDAGFGLCTFVCPQVTSDDGDFTDGLAALFYPDGKRGPHDGGKIALWAWAASRVADELVKMPEVDARRLIAVGHSRMGKTALWAGASDERFAGVVSVQSGCSGASLARGSGGETVADITGRFPYWFAPAYAAYAGRAEAMPFDQHFLLAAVAPRPLYVTSAAADLWADPLSEYLGCMAVSPVYTLLGKRPLEEAEALTDRMRLHGGDVGYARRPGTHCFSRADWQNTCDFMREKL